MSPHIAGGGGIRRLRGPGNARLIHVLPPLYKPPKNTPLLLPYRGYHPFNSRANCWSPDSGNSEMQPRLCPYTRQVRSPQSMYPSHPFGDTGRYPSTTSHCIILYVMLYVG